MKAGRTTSRSVGRSTAQRVCTMLLSLALALSMMPVFAFAESCDTVKSGTFESLETDPEAIRTDVNISDGDSLLESYLQEQMSAGAATGDKRRTAPRGDRFTGNNAVIYNALKTHIVKVANGEESSTRIEISTSALEGGDRNYTADDLGVDSIRIGDGLNPALSDAFLRKFNIDMTALVNALLTDLPYDLYWYDKTIGCSYGIGCRGTDTSVQFTRLQISFCAAESYKGTGGYYTIDTEKTSAAKAAAQKARAIITENAGKSDIAKLINYKETICDLVAYNKLAPEGGINYGDPWQIIYVFDGKPGTNVVCEGYSKAFQFLCDNTAFTDDNISCLTVTGGLYNLSNGHMWNVLHMDDGKNYIADITNCDAGTVAMPDKAFLKGASGSVDGGYTLNNSESLKYYYDTVTLSQFSTEELTLEESPYYNVEWSVSNGTAALYIKGVKRGTGNFEQRSETLKPTCCSNGYNAEIRTASIDGIELKSYSYLSSLPMTEHSMSKNKSVVDPPTCTKAGIGMISDCCEVCGLEYRETYTLDPLGHNWDGGVVTQKATVKAKGSKLYTCRRCGDVRTETIAKLKHTHKWVSKKYLDKTVYTCRICGAKKTKVKVTVDRPKAKTVKTHKVSNGFSVSWKKLSSAKRRKISGYEVQYSTTRQFTYAKSKVVRAGKKKLFKKVTGLGHGKKYYVRVRTYKWINGKKHVSKWSAVKTVRTG